MWDVDLIGACGMVGMEQGITVALQSLLIFIIGVLPRCIIRVTCTPEMPIMELSLVVGVLFIFIIMSGQPIHRKASTAVSACLHMPN